MSRFFYFYVHCILVTVVSLSDLGLQAAHRVMSSSPQLALKVLKDIAQSVPMAAKSLYRLPVSKELRKEITDNQKVKVNSLY